MTLNRTNAQARTSKNQLASEIGTSMLGPLVPPEPSSFGGALYGPDLKTGVLSEPLTGSTLAASPEKAGDTFPRHV